MGAIHDPEEDARAVAVLLDMPDEARIWLNHHVGNPLSLLLNAKAFNDPAQVVKAAEHIIEDMQRIGCFKLRKSKGGDSNAECGI